MATRVSVSVSPVFAIPPGETLKETLESLQMTQAELAERTGKTTKTVNEVIKGKASITPEFALQLQHAIGVPASFWNNLEKDYQQALAEQRERSRLLATVSWLSQIPVGELAKRGWIQRSPDKVCLLRQVLGFFGVSSAVAWEKMWLSPRVAFHKSRAFESSPGAIAAWLRIGQLKAKEIDCKPYDRSAFRSQVDGIRNELTTASLAKVKHEIIDRCRACGVAVVFESEIKGSYVSGATQWISSEKAVLQLSCRHKTNDQFWHAFFHESAHILLHGKRDIFVDTGKETEHAPAAEKEANEFAAELLIPAVKMQTFLRTSHRSEKDIVRFATEVGVAPGIVVGQLQHMGILSFSYLNHLKVMKFDLTAVA